MAESVLAAVRVAPSTTELRELPMPELSDDVALLKVEVAGICGTDVKMYAKPPFEERVFPRMCNVRSLDEVITGLTPAVLAAAGQ